MKRIFEWENVVRREKERGDTFGLKQSPESSLRTAEMSGFMSQTAVSAAFMEESLVKSCTNS